MAFVHHESNKCTKSELDMFSIRPTQTSISKGQWIEYHPLSNITDTGPIECNVAGSGEEYLDLARTQLYVKAKITKPNGANLDHPDTKVGPVNLFLHSLFSQVDVALNERMISPSTNTYPYRAMLETLLNYGEEAKTSQLSMSLFYKDTPGKMAVVNPVAQDADANLVLKARYAFTINSNAVDMMGPIHSDLFFQERLLLNGVNLRIRLNRTKNTFCLVSSAALQIKVVILQAILYVRKVKVAPSISLGHAAPLKQATAKYPIRRIECKVLSIPGGFPTFTPDNIFLGQIPKRIVLGLVDTEAYNGSYGTNPFDFKNHKLTQVGVYVDGEQIPRKPLFLKFDVAGGQNCIAGFQSLFSGIGKFSQDTGNQLTRTDYYQGYTLFAFDLTPDHCPGEHFELIKQGNLRVEIHFAQPLPSTVNLIIYAEFQNVIEIDANRDVLYDYTN